MDQSGAVSAESLILPHLPNSVPDFDLPVVFGQPRHYEPICGTEDVELEWRVKDRVILYIHSKMFYMCDYCLTDVFSTDENCQRRSRALPECWRRSA